MKCLGGVASCTLEFKIKWFFFEVIASRLDLLKVATRKV